MPYGQASLRHQSRGKDPMLTRKRDGGHKRRNHQSQGRMPPLPLRIAFRRRRRDEYMRILGSYRASFQAPVAGRC